MVAVFPVYHAIWSAFHFSRSIQTTNFPEHKIQTFDVSHSFHRHFLMNYANHQILYFIRYEKWCFWRDFKIKRKKMFVLNYHRFPLKTFMKETAINASFLEFKTMSNERETYLPVSCFPDKFRWISRSSPPEVFCKKGVTEGFAKFTGKHLCQSLFLIKLQAWGLQLY